jgi:hypothetical protein
MQKALCIKDEEWMEFLNQRKRIVPMTIMNWLKFDQKVK